MTRWRTRLRGSRAERGAAAVEFAIVLVVLLLIIFAIIDFGRLLFAVQGAKSASREGARTAVIQSATNVSVNTSINDAVNAAASLAGAGGSSGALRNWQLNWPAGTAVSPAIPTATPATASLCTSATKGQPITVQVIVPFTWFTPAGIFASSVNTAQAETTMRCE